MFDIILSSMAVRNVHSAGCGIHICPRSSATGFYRLNEEKNDDGRRSFGHLIGVDFISTIGGIRWHSFVVSLIQPGGISMKWRGGIGVARGGGSGVAGGAGNGGNGGISCRCYSSA